jgi:hypothetical protein
MKSAPVQSSPSVEVAGEELATQKEVKLTDPGVEAEGVASAEATAAPALSLAVASPQQERERRFFKIRRSKSTVSLNLFYFIIDVL